MWSAGTMPSSADSDHRPGRGRDDIEREVILVGAGLERRHEALDVLLQSHLLACLDQMLAAYAPKLGIVAKEIRELGALLDQVNVRKTGDLLAKVRHADQLAENEPGIVEAQRLVEVAGDEVVAGRCPAGGHVDSPTLWMQR